MWCLDKRMEQFLRFRCEMSATLLKYESNVPDTRLHATDAQDLLVPLSVPERCTPEEYGQFLEQWYHGAYDCLPIPFSKSFTAKLHGSSDSNDNQWCISSDMPLLKVLQQVGWRQKHSHGIAISRGCFDMQQVEQLCFRHSQEL